jgi:hypothetical protein
LFWTGVLDTFPVAVPYIELVVEVVVGAGEFVENCLLLCADAAEAFSTGLFRIRGLVVNTAGAAAFSLACVEKTC